MKKLILFSLWKIESIEKYLETMEKQGYRLEKTRHSYLFYFKKSSPRQMSYFISYKSFKGKSMGQCDYYLLSNHKAHPIASEMCYYTMYRTKESKENLSLLYEFRLDFIKKKLLENVLASLFLTILFLAIFLFALINQSVHNAIYVFSPILAVCLILSIYYFYGYFKQRRKCNIYEKGRRQGDGSAC